MIEKSTVINIDAEELILGDLSGETVYITLMTPKEVEKMYEEHPELKEMFQS